MDPSKTLVAIWIGINDIGDTDSYIFPSNNSTDFPSLYTNIINTEFAAIETIYQAGFRNYLFMNLPPLQRTVRFFDVIVSKCITLLMYISPKSHPISFVQPVLFQTSPCSPHTTTSSTLPPSILQPHIRVPKLWFSILFPFSLLYLMIQPFMVLKTSRITVLTMMRPILRVSSYQFSFLRIHVRR